MKTDNFIEFASQDAKASRPLAFWRFGMISISIIFPITIGYLEGFHSPIEEFLDPKRILTLGLLFVSLASLPLLILHTWMYFTKVRVGLAFGLALATVSILFKTFPGFSGFFHNPLPLPVHLACFSFGIGVSFVTFAGQWILMRLRGPLPDNVTALALAIGSGLGGLLALDMHCASLDFFHLMVAHIGHSLIVTPVTFYFLKWNTQRRISSLKVRL